MMMRPPPPPRSRPPRGRVVACVAALAWWAASAAPARADAVTVGYQTGVDPAKAAVGSDCYAAALGDEPHWRRFASGPAVVAALAAGDIDVGNLGSVPLAAGLARGLPITVFLVSARIGAAEALVVRPAITTPAALRGKTIATPFGSTSHYSLLNALRDWGLRPDQLRLVNLGPADIAAAWRRGDLDGAFVWSPTLTVLRRDGRVLTDAARVGARGAPTFEVWVARSAFARTHAAWLRGFSAVSLAAYAAYRRDPAGWLTRHGRALAQVTGAPPAQLAELLRGADFPLEPAQHEQLDGAAALASQATARFLWRQNVIATPPGDYASHFSAAYLPGTTPQRDQPCID